MSGLCVLLLRGYDAVPYRCSPQIVIRISWSRPESALRHTIWDSPVNDPGWRVAADNVLYGRAELPATCIKNSGCRRTLTECTSSISTCQAFLSLAPSAQPFPRRARRGSLGGMGN